MLYDLTTRQWVELATHAAAYPQWSRDGKYIYFYTYFSADQPLFRLRITDRKIEQSASLKELRLIGRVGVWMGLAPDDSPLLLRDVGSQDSYAPEWQAP